MRVAESITQHSLLVHGDGDLIVQRAGGHSPEEAATHHSQAEGTCLNRAGSNLEENNRICKIHSD